MMTEGVGTVKSPGIEPLPHDQRVPDYGIGRIAGSSTSGLTYTIFLFRSCCAMTLRTIGRIHRPEARHDHPPLDHLPAERNTDPSS